MYKLRMKRQASFPRGERRCFVRRSELKGTNNRNELTDMFSDCIA